MIFQHRQENTFFYVYKDPKGITKQDITSIIGGKNELRVLMKKRGCYITKIFNLKNLREKAKSVNWSQNKLLQFTTMFKLEMEKGRAWNLMSERNSIGGVMTYMFDPVVYYIYTELDNWKKFNEVIKMFPNIFDPVYVWICEWFFGKKYEPIEWLELLEQRIIESQQYVSDFIKKASPYLLAIVASTIIALFLDFKLFDSLTEEYAEFNKILPDFTLYFHEYLRKLVIFGPIFIGIIYAIMKLLQNSRNEELKISFGKLMLWVPLYGKILHKKSVYDFVNIYYLLRQANSIIPRDILYTTALSVPSYYIKTIFLEIYEAILEWKNIGDEMQQYDVFNEEQDVIKVFKTSIDNVSELKATRDIYKKRTDKEIWWVILKLVAVCVTLSVLMFFCIFGAYFVPIQKKASLFKEQLNDQKLEQSINNNK